MAWAQERVPDTFHITEPPVTDPSASGWSVEPRLGRLTVTIPLGVMPGEITFPISVVMNGTPTTRAKNVPKEEYFGKEDQHTILTYTEARTVLPIEGRISFGHIKQVPGGMQYSLEDGRTYYDSDFVKTDQPFDARRGGSISLFQAYGFTFPTTRTDWSISADGSLVRCNYSHPYTNFGSRYDSIIKSAVPTWDFIKTCTSNLAWRTTPQFAGYVVLMDRDRARIYSSYTYQRPDTEHCIGTGDNRRCTTTLGESGIAYVPICIVDRFGHYVTFRWSSSGSVRRVDVRNQRDLGFTVRFHNGATNLARVDFVNFSQPSALISGYSPLPPWSTTGSETYTRTVWTPDLLGRPTSVTIGVPASVPQPSWNNAAGSPSAPPPTPSPDGSVESRSWALTYNGDQTVVASLTTPLGVRSTFQTQVHSVYQTANSFETTIPHCRFPDAVTGVMRVEETDVSGKSDAFHAITWSRQIDATPDRPNAIQVTKWNNWRDAAQSPSDRYERYWYGDSTIQPINPTDVGNGFLTRWAMYSSASVEWATRAYQSRTETTSLTYSKGSGLNRYLSSMGQATQSRSGELSIHQVFGAWDETGLQPRTATTFVREGDSAPWSKIQEHTTYFNNQWAMAEVQQLAKTETTRFDPSTGSVIAPGVTTTSMTWDGAAPPLLLLQKSFTNNSSLQHGSTYTYTADGKVATSGLHHLEGGVTSASPSTQTQTYDGSTGLLTEVTTAYQEGGTTSTLTKKSTDFDAGHRAQLSMDEKGITTRSTYDLFGRPTSITTDGEAPISITYPDEWTKIGLFAISCG